MNWRSFTRPYTAIPVILLAILSMVILPLPGWLLDVLFTFNIVLSIIVLLVAVSTKKPLDFSVFPTILLVATLMRLTLNIASTRVVLLHGHEGSDVAGRVIQAFGEVVIGGNYVVGIVVFVILMVINFVVITKGGERISEVAARFTLDAMPGKQMAIDADLNAGLIGPEQAKERRSNIAQEADFYGSMDGASKFVRGDAIAGLIILVINLLGGVSIGAFQHGLSLAEAFQRFALLTIGDGLVAQIPSLLLAVAAAIIVTRMNDEGDVSETVGKQLLASPRVILTAALIMVVLGIVPGMPTVAFLGFAAPLFYVAWRLQKSQPTSDLLEAEQITDTILSEQQASLEWRDISHVDKLAVELGFRLVYLADKDKGEELVKTLRGVRKNLSEQLGFLLPEIRIKDNLKLNPQEYKVNLAGVAVANGHLNAKELLALNTGDVYGTLDGEITTDPAYGLEAVWIKDDSKAKALNMGYSVVDLGTVIATHTGKVIKDHLDELFSYEDVQRLNERLKEISPSLAETFEKALPTNLQLKVIRLLLREHISIKDIVTIAGTLIDSVEVTKDPILLVSDVRCALQKVLVKQVMGNRDELAAYSLDEKLESTMQSSLDQAMQAGKVSLDSFPVDPNLLGQFQRMMPLLVDDMKSRGVTPTLIVIPQLRPLLARYAKTFTKGGLVVLSYNEIPDFVRVDILGSLG
ncbi:MULTISPECIES: flagellar biosynthesis protein FlhA [Pseudoalteromonas]|uniref:Flagellar biosynthesis protein FlhA n=1 Tax=Pseudoalteromonas aliena SW19 TaxID=1314866 RepID=A0ABR9E0G9_9GAMM|nr:MULTISPECIES: flagellar biosynthesis protein FlhA [Pseudoalteromonas]MBB1387120.1 flagellar biosynthesis protein FlhA [Pseudoalteromonas sp. SG45-5]MBB1395223.1 flagellar biosynthesis protein FlhA [Pseudoalteromonas sp. SG44-4]MBB1447257.1 flagellar biosynthesis protein FlhA [Pseudoalteromonas sp. SG41-6]MBE0359873.1 flagellar biosynthesis protein FlhA [Pseudoalteromonas aliena SW19]